MQTDIWLTQPAQPTQCPLCSKPLTASSKTCYACGFSLESPISTSSSVWIDPAVYTYKPSDSSPDAQASEISRISPKPVKPTGSVVWEGTADPQPQLQTRQRTGGISVPPTGKHTSSVSKSVARPVHTRRRTYTRSLTQTQDGNPSARPSAPQPPMWQYESPNFEAGSSLPALSLLVAETPTQPGIALPDVVDGTAIDEIDTMPPLAGRRSHKPPADDSFLISGSSLISDAVFTAKPLADDSFLTSDAVSTAEPTEGTHQSSQAPASHAHIDEIDTVPEHVRFMAPSQGVINHAPTSPAHLDEIDTAPDHVGVQFSVPSSSRALVPVNSQVAPIPVTNSSSWTAGGSARSGYARRIADRSPYKRPRSTFSLNPFDSVRWWLLRPGRIEFILWLGGTVLLISVTCVLLLVTAFSLNWITPGLRSSVTSSTPSLTNTSPQGHVLPTVTNTPGLVLTLLDKGFIRSGQSVRVHGQGFTPNGKVVFTLDNPQLPPNPTVWTDADAHGGFTTILSLGYLSPGPHLIIAHDMKTDNLAAIPFRIEGDFGKAATATPVVPAVPGATVTPTPGQPGGGGNPITPTPPIAPSPVGATPVTTPTVGTTPTPTPTKTPPTPTPTPSPTAVVTPTPTPVTTPTPKPSPTAAVPPASSPTPTTSPTAAVPLSSALSDDNDSEPGDGLSNALGSNTPGFYAQLVRFAPWLWLPVLLCTFSMLMLGIAGILHKRRIP